MRLYCFLSWGSDCGLYLNCFPQIEFLASCRYHLTGFCFLSLSLNVYLNTLILFEYKHDLPENHSERFQSHFWTKDPGKTEWHATLIQMSEVSFKLNKAFEVQKATEVKTKCKAWYRRVGWRSRKHARQVKPIKQIKRGRRTMTEPFPAVKRFNESHLLIRLNIHLYHRR